MGGAPPQEHRLPTLVNTPERLPVHANARFIVDETTGAVRWYELNVGEPGPVRLQVTFTWNGERALSLPAEMLEEFGVSRRKFRGEGRATYRNWRRFGVETRLLPQP